MTAEVGGGALLGRRLPRRSRRRARSPTPPATAVREDAAGVRCGSGGTRRAPPDGGGSRADRAQDRYALRRAARVGAAGTPRSHPVAARGAHSRTEPAIRSGRGAPAPPDQEPRHSAPRATRTGPTWPVRGPTLIRSLSEIAGAPPAQSRARSPPHRSRACGGTRARAAPRCRRASSAAARCTPRSPGAGGSPRRTPGGPGNPSRRHGLPL